MAHEHQAPSPQSTQTAPSSAVAEEISLFGGLADTWWDETGPFAPLHQMNPLRISYIRDHLTALTQTKESQAGTPLDSMSPLQGMRLLDVGCGGGILSEPLARLGAHMTSIDAAEEGIQAAKAHATSQGLDIDYRCATAESLLAQMTETNAPLFDAVCALEIIEHVANPEQFIHTLSQLVRPGGTLILSTINRTPLSFAVAIVGAEYVTRKIPRGTHDWRKFLPPHQLAHFCRASHLEVKDVKGMVMNPINNSWRLSSKRTRINYIMTAQKPEQSILRPLFV